MADPHIEFTMADGKRMRFGLASLERLREAVLVFLSDPDDVFLAKFSDRQAGFIDELSNSRFIIDLFGNARIAQWILEKDAADVLRLVRHPPRSPIMILFFARVERRERGGWAVCSFGHRRVQALRS